MKLHSRTAEFQAIGAMADADARPVQKQAGLRSRIAARWYRVFHALICRFYFSRITVLHPERFPKDGAVLFLGIHRNGAVDGFVFRNLTAGATFLISTQLRKSLLGRLFFCGIEVARTKDEGDHSVNAPAMSQCVGLLRAGGRLFVFPEGTSSLGPRHLQFKSGAARIALDHLASGRHPLHIIPLGIHYECAWAFRSRVEIVVGGPIDTTLPGGLSELGRLKEMRRRFTHSLEAVGFNVQSQEELELSERLAYAGTLGTKRSYANMLKALECGIPPGLRDAIAMFDSACADKTLWRHQGVPLFPAGPVSAYTIALILLAPVVATGFLLNLPPLAAGFFAARRFADDRNVIALWRILVGVPAFMLWSAAATCAMAFFAGPSCVAAYLVLTWAAWAGWYRLKKLAVAVHNGVLHPSLRAAAFSLRDKVLSEVPDHDCF
jgi:1-acyl-sn-glycerol-3-phosphate acyltransferase